MNQIDQHPYDKLTRLSLYSLCHHFTFESFVWTWFFNICTNYLFSGCLIMNHWTGSICLVFSILVFNCSFPFPQCYSISNYLPLTITIKKKLYELVKFLGHFWVHSLSSFNFFHTIVHTNLWTNYLEKCQFILNYLKVSYDSYITLWIQYRYR